jgi:hypothetical protein
MRKFLICCLSLLIFFICTAGSCKKSNNPEEYPSTPVYIAPDSGSTVYGSSVELIWHASRDYHPSDGMEYLVYYANQSLDIFDEIRAETADTFFTLIDLQPLDTIYWLIVAQDDGGQTEGATWFFEVGDPANYNMPINPDPDNGAVDINIDAVISWEYAGNTGDVIYCDVYFGTDQNPALAVSQLNDMTYDPGTLEFLAQYYWKIVAYTSPTEFIEGPVWTFTTGDELDLEMPTNPSPDSGAISVSVATGLSWDYTGTPGDVIYCDVYFGTVQNPPLVSDDQNGTAYDPPGNLDYITTYYWKIVSFTSATDSIVGPVWSFTTESVAEQGIYAQFLFKADILYEYFAMDEIRARFDSSYAPDAPIDTLQADSVRVNGTAMIWNSYSGFYSYSEDPSLHWLVDGGAYYFEVFGNAHVPDLTLQTSWLECVPMLIYPTSADTIYNAGFTTTWDGICAGSVILTFVIAGNDTTDVWIETPNDGEYTFTSSDLAPLGGHQGVITEVIMAYDQYYINEPGYLQSSEVIMRSTHSVSTIIE